MSSATYTRYELLRTVRERRLMIFGFGFPLVLYFVIAVPNRHMEDFAGSGVTAPLYYMVSLASFGTLMSMVSLGGRIAGEREAGWTRQLRIPPLSTRSYLRANVRTGGSRAALSLGLLDIGAAAVGVSISATDWIKTTL